MPVASEDNVARNAKTLKLNEAAAIENGLTSAMVASCEEVLAGCKDLLDVRLPAQFRELLTLAMAGEFDRTETLALQMFRAGPVSVDESVLFIHILVAMSELRFDMPSRERYLRLWNERPDWVTSPYARFTRTYQDAIGAFFLGHLQTAELRLQNARQIAKGAQLAISELRAVFHLGLVQRDLGRMDKAHGEFLTAWDLAAKLGARSFSRRIQVELDKIRQRLDSKNAIPQIELEGLLRGRNFSAARTAYVRRVRGIRRLKDRRADSLYVYLPLILRGLKKTEFARIAMASIEDPVLRRKILDLKSQIFGLDQGETAEVHWLSGQLGVSNVRVSYEESGEEYWLLGKKIAELENEDVRAFANMLIRHRNGVNKERICTEIWRIPYDPVFHDPKIYKLVLKFREIFGSKEIILNNYGTYSLNPALVASTP